MKFKLATVLGLGLALSSTFTTTGCLFEDDEDTTATVKPAAGTAVTKSDTIRLGSWKAAAPSCIDADMMKSYKSADAKTNAATIDFCFYNEAAGGEFFMSPKIAAGQGQGANEWAVQNATMLLMVTADFAAITTQEAIDALWDEAKADGKVAATNGKTYIVKTEKGKKVLIMVTAKPSEGDAAEILIKGTK